MLHVFICKDAMLVNFSNHVVHDLMTNVGCQERIAEWAHTRSFESDLMVIHSSRNFQRDIHYPKTKNEAMDIVSAYKKSGFKVIGSPHLMTIKPEIEPMTVHEDHSYIHDEGDYHECSSTGDYCYCDDSMHKHCDNCDGHCEVNRDYQP